MLGLSRFSRAVSPFSSSAVLVTISSKGKSVPEKQQHQDDDNDTLKLKSMAIEKLASECVTAIRDDMLSFHDDYESIDVSNIDPLIVAGTNRLATEVAHAVAAMTTNSVYRQSNQAGRRLLSTVPAASSSTFEFYFDIVCPFACLASLQVEKVAARTGSTVIWKPVLLGGIYKMTEAPQGKDGSATDVMKPNKQAIIARDLELQYQRRGFPFVWNHKHPAKSLQVQRLLASAPPHVVPSMAATLYRKYWSENVDISEDSVVQSIAQQYNVSITDQGKKLLEQNTSEAVARGCFGVPSFYIPKTNQLFFGQDRLHFVEAAITGSASSDYKRHGYHRLCRQPLAKKQTLTFFHDFSSPWSYLGSTQVFRIAEENLAEIQVVPILLGALFKQIGTANVPLFTVPQVKRDAMTRDLQHWCDWWGVKLNWPSTFPLRSVTALRMSIVEPKLLPILYEAAWVNDENIGDETVLENIVTRSGFNYSELLQEASEDGTKQILRENTDLLVKLGGCGVPTFRVNEEPIIWGQDRFDVVADMLCGWRPSTAGQQQSRL